MCVEDKLFLSILLPCYVMLWPKGSQEVEVCSAVLILQKYPCCILQNNDMYNEMKTIFKSNFVTCKFSI